MTEKSESKRIGAKQHKNSGRNTQKGDASWNNLDRRRFTGFF